MTTIDRRRRRLLRGAALATVGSVAGCTSGDHQYETVPGRRGKSGKVPGGTETATSTPEPDDISVTIDAEDQESGGEQVTIASVGIDQPGWIGIYPSDDGGSPDTSTVIGTQRLEIGEYTDRTVALDEPITKDQTLHAGLHDDDPENGEFDYPDGDPILTAGAYKQISSFEVTISG